uniref:Protein kinase domain-containing protein n=2 Tax=Oryza brachyantha TaxID=4533 RepID=J3LUM2_ORYBR
MDGGEGEGRTLLVGVQADAASRTLLTWTFINVAAPGDRIVAVHVVLASAPGAATAVDFDTMLAVYEGFCNLKQINLKLKICKDSSVRKALVREANLFGASKVIVGIAKKKRGISSVHSVAKYCSKKLPAKCAVLAVDSGKIVFRRESNVHSGKVSAELPGCGDNEMYCEMPFLARHCKEEPLPLNEPKDGGGGGEEEEHDVGTKGTQPVNNVSGEQQPSGADPAELPRDQVRADVGPSDKGEELTADQKDEISELPGEGASVLYCVLPERNGHSAASTSSRQSGDLAEPPAEGDGELYCILPPRTGHSGRSSGDSSRSTVSLKHDDSATLSAEADGELYCRLPRTGRSGRSSGGSKRSFSAKGLIRRSSSFSSDIQLNSETSPSKKDGSVCAIATERTSSMVSTEAEDSPKNAAQNVDTPSSSPLSLRRMIEGRPDRCRLRRRIFNHQRSSSFEWAKISMVQWAMRLPSRYTSVSDNKSLKSDASPRLNCDSECESTSAVDTESLFSFSLYDMAWPPSELESLQEKSSSTCRLFTYEELKLATSNFSQDMLIGKGGTSQVYKALLFDGTLSAVKILKPSVDALQEFITEVEIATSLQHDNIVSLRGFSSDNYSLVLVYDYMPQGSLDKALHGKHESKDSLSWEKRNNIAIGTAKALEYLHHGSVTQSVIHGDVKSSNILLSEDFQAQLCDFGLAKQVSTSTPHLTCTDITGTFGYLAPEYFSHGKVNEKIDVYAFGVVILEIISGRKPIRTGCAKGQESLVGWAKPLLSNGEIKQLVDPFLGNDYDCDEMERMTLAASLCTRTSSHSRPEMSQILKLLEGDDETIHWARSQVTASFDGSDEEAVAPDSNMQSHLNLALLGVDDDTLSHCSTEQTMDTSADGYWSRSSSFD